MKDWLKMKNAAFERQNNFPQKQHLEYTKYQLLSLLPK